MQKKGPFVQFSAPKSAEKRRAWPRIKLSPSEAVAFWLDKREWKGFAHRFRPMYAGANMGHPSSSGVAPESFGLRPER